MEDQNHQSVIKLKDKIANLKAPKKSIPILTDKEKNFVEFVARIIVQKTIIDAKKKGLIK